MNKKELKREVEACYAAIDEMVGPAGLTIRFVSEKGELLFIVPIESDLALRIKAAANQDGLSISTWIEKVIRGILRVVDIPVETDKEELAEAHSDPLYEAQMRAIAMDEENEDDAAEVNTNTPEIGAQAQVKRPYWQKQMLLLMKRKGRSYS